MRAESFKHFRVRAGCFLLGAYIPVVQCSRGVKWSSDRWRDVTRWRHGADVITFKMLRVLVGIWRRSFNNIIQPSFDAEYLENLVRCKFDFYLGSMGKRLCWVDWSRDRWRHAGAWSHCGDILQHAS